VRFERRLRLIERRVTKGSPDLCDMSDDELAQVITGNHGTMACDISDEQLEAVMRKVRQ
jgi:hypothetical protein